MSDSVSQRNAPNEQPEAVQVRLNGPVGAPRLIYLPGLHGDWTLLTGFRCAVEKRVRLSELTYPRTLDWSLARYASEVVTRLKEEGIFDGWLLGESFGSQVVWEILKQGEFKAQAAILAGGFGRHPFPWAAALAAKLSGPVAYFLLRQCLSAYKSTARLRFGRSAKSKAALEEFVLRRTWRDFQAARHRLRLVAGADPGMAIQAARLPVYPFTGLFD